MTLEYDLYDSRLDRLAGFEESHGFDPLGIYCQFTGARIGTTTDDEMGALLDSLVGDSEEVHDDLAIRILASMRPSIRWNKMRAETLQQMRVADPIGTTAYLINRLFAPLNHRKIGIEELLGYNADRIKAHALLREWGVTDESNTILYMLLELDAKWNLDTESAPFTAYDFFFDAPTMQHRVEMLQAWYERRCDAWEKKQKADEMQIKWSRSGNALAKPAFMDAFVESKPITKTGAIKAKKKEESDFMAGLLSEIMMGKPESEAEVAAIAPKPVLIAIHKTPLAFGIK
jgi:hypothetical protein